MNSEFSEEAQSLGDAVAETLGDAGGVDLAREAEKDPASRAKLIEPLLDPLGLWEIEPLEDQLQLEAAAAATHAAGGHLLTYPIAERLAGPEGSEGLLFVPRSGRSVAVHADLPLDWTGVDIFGDRAIVSSAGTSVGTKLGSFVGEVSVSGWNGSLVRHAALLHTLQAWWLLGVLERTAADTTTYVREREQFGRPLAKFQAVQFTLTELAVANQGLMALAKYTTWSLAQEDRESFWLADALGLRVQALDAAQTVMRGGHQLHGAMGFADETNISWYSRVSQGVRRLPAGQSQTEAALVQVVGTRGITNLYTPLPALETSKS